MARGARGSAGTTPPGDWWRSYFDAGYLDEYSPVFDLIEERRQVARLTELLALPHGARVLDLACGQGRHAHLLAEAGFNVDGLDYSRDMLKAAKARGTGKTLRYTRGDMRRLPLRWTRRFDGVVNLFTSFGFFDDPADDARVLKQVARMLKRGGVFIWQGGNRDALTDRFLRGDAWTTAEGTAVRQDRHFDPRSGFLTIESTWTRRRKVERRTHRIRLYTATHLEALLQDAGLTVTGVYDGFREGPLTRGSHEMLLVARRGPPR
ncbi:methyltransferase domain-containing protein [Pseudogemmatithrix spongiicola]|uniref:Methyltransferase domain-containing protein n=1 Tax=Pseudogemmatithrix spongiicola TaxID=3062599 RepID=A0AA49Q7W6_9BACT|nr:methyltransferase domain-containing protein [Gemmatimonadaceae bacterium 'strain 138']WKW15206.1 methyltransferase domain-containing protein [Gemmatimonadaceae bacterium 'strain 318']